MAIVDIRPGDDVVYIAGVPADTLEARSAVNRLLLWLEGRERTTEPSEDDSDPMPGRAVARSASTKRHVAISIKPDGYAWQGVLLTDEAAGRLVRSIGDALRH